MFLDGNPDGERPRERLDLTWLFLHAGIGIAMGVSFAAVVILANVADIGTMLRESSEPFIPMLLFFVSCAVTFGSAKMGIAVMTLPYEKDDDEDEDGQQDEDGPERP